MQHEPSLTGLKPWMLIDRVVRHEPGREVVTKKLISASDYFLIGHFPEYSVYPGMLLLQGMFQSALVLKGNSPTMPPKIRSFNARFLRSAVPGDTIVYTVSLKSMDKGIAVYSGVGIIGMDEVIRASWSGD